MSWTSPYTTVVGSIADRDLVRQCLRGVTAVLHPATLHKPHVGSHDRQAFVDTNITGTLTLLEESVAAGVGSFVFTSTTSAFGRALTPGVGEPATWITEEVVPVPRNIYGVTKTAAENLCELVHRDHGLPVVVLRTSRFFPEADDRDEVRTAYEDANLKANEYLYRRVDLQDAVDAHLLARRRRPRAGLRPPHRERDDALRRGRPGRPARFGAVGGGQAVPVPARRSTRSRGWRMFDEIDRVYVNDRARSVLGWRPRYDFAHVLARFARRRGLP